jgi:hypothetical protein
MLPLNLFDALIDDGLIKTTGWANGPKGNGLMDLFEVVKIRVLDEGNAYHFTRHGQEKGRAYKTLAFTLIEPNGKMREITMTLWSRNNGLQGRKDLKILERKNLKTEGRIQ